MRGDTKEDISVAMYLKQRNKVWNSCASKTCMVYAKKKHVWCYLLEF
jgi:hypothetical protein